MKMLKKSIIESISIGNYIKGLREDRDLTQEQAATDMGITRRILSGWERGVKPLKNIDDINMLAKYYDVDFFVFCEIAIDKRDKLYTRVDTLSLEITKNVDSLRQIRSYAQSILNLIENSER